MARPRKRPDLKPVAAPAKNAETSGDKTWQQTKSEITRNTILDAAIDCFYELGYGNTTTEKVAKRAGVSRGAMLHHFPSRLELIKAAVARLSAEIVRDLSAQQRMIGGREQYRGACVDCLHGAVGARAGCGLVLKPLNGSRLD